MGTPKKTKKYYVKILFSKVSIMSTGYLRNGRNSVKMKSYSLLDFYYLLEYFET